MDLDLPLLLVAVLSAAILAGRSVRARPIAKDWLAVSLFVLATAGAGWLILREWVALVTFGLWVVLGWGPTLLSRGVVAATMRLHGRLAFRLSQLMVLVHPSLQLREHARRMNLIALEHEGRRTEALAAIDGAIERMAGRAAPAALLWEQVQRLRLGESWDDLDAASEAITDDLVRQNPGLLTLLLRVDLELGRRSRAFERFRRLAALLAPGVMAQARHVAALMMFAFAGRRRDVDALLEGSLRGYAPAYKDLWTSTADAVNSDRTALARLVALSRSGEGLVAGAARPRTLFLDRLADDPIDLGHHQMLDRLARSIETEHRYRFGAVRPVTPVVTWIYAALIGVVFALEVLRGGSMNEDVLFELGGLNPALVLEGQWFRVVAFLFLHYGAVHVAFNTIGLVFLGPFAERALGRLRFAGVYLASGLMGGVLWVVEYSVLDRGPVMLVGASGCVMGIVGATAAVLLRAYRTERLIVARNRLLIIALVVALQTCADLMMEGVSLFAHAVGAITGFVLTLLLAHRFAASPAGRVIPSPAQ